jgi:hypothetical protein
MIEDCRFVSRLGGIRSVFLGLIFAGSAVKTSAVILGLVISLD